MTLPACATLWTPKRFDTRQRLTTNIAFHPTSSLHSRMSKMAKFLLASMCISLGSCFVETRHLGLRPTFLSATGDIPITVIAVTREDGKNGKLIEQISQDEALKDQIKILELPCIEHGSGPDYDSLEMTLASKKWDYVVVTSPEAAKVLASAWDVVRDNPIPVAAVGKATEKVLEEYNISVSFVPTKANAETLAKELEFKGEGTALLYPASARAKQTLQKGLESRGFKVTRLNTYDTVTANWSEEQKQQAKDVKIACFASPSSIKGWLHNTGDKKDVVAACIGRTSATSCVGHEWDERQIFYPESPGLEGWVDTIKEALENVNVSQS